MPLFIIETTAESPIREFWQVEAATAQDARDKFDNGETGAFLWDEVTGDETGREVSQVHGADDLASTVAIHRAQQAAPAMLAALQKAHAALALVEHWDAGTGGAHPDIHNRALDDAAAAIAAATSAPTDETGAAAPTAIQAGEYRLEPSQSGEGFTLSRRCGAYAMRRHVSADKLAAILSALDCDDPAELNGER